MTSPKFQENYGIGILNEVKQVIGAGLTQVKVHDAMVGKQGVGRHAQSAAVAS